MEYPAVEPVSDAEALNYLRAAAADTDLIHGLIVAAREQCEVFTGRVLARRKFAQALDSFPYFTDTIQSQLAMPPSYYSLPRYSTTLWNYSQMIKLAYAPLIEVFDIRYIDQHGVTQKLNPGTDFVGIPAWVQTYRVCRLSMPHQAVSLQFHESEALPVLKKMLSQIVAVEGPVHKDVAATRLARAWELERVGERMMSAVQATWRSLSRENVLRIQGHFLWPTLESFEVKVRRPDPDDEYSYRSIGEIPPEEIAVAMKNVVRDSLSIERDTLLSHVARILGFDRTGNHIQRALEAVFAELADRGEIILLGDRISLRG
jgi:hypothetical protein